MRRRDFLSLFLLAPASTFAEDGLLIDVIAAPVPTMAVTAPRLTALDRLLKPSFSRAVAAALPLGPNLSRLWWSLETACSASLRALPKKCSQPSPQN